MASEARRRAENVPGPFFVDDTCIDCGTCMWMAPATFREAGPQSAVHQQPQDTGAVHRAAQAAVACPTASIGGATPRQIRRARDAFPSPVTDGVWHLGFHARSSFGAASYLVATRAGNLLVDVPRFNKPLCARLDEMGGVQGILLTHRDDIADHERFAAHFGCKRFIHEGDAAALPDAEAVFGGEEKLELLPGVTAIPTPGHTRGSTCYLVGETLFTGDHLAWDPAGRLKAFRRACWYDWDKQIASMERLRGHRFNRVLPGHGHPATLTPDKMRAALADCIEWMRSA